MQKSFWRFVGRLESVFDWAKNTTPGQITTLVVIVIIGLIVTLLTYRPVTGFAVIFVLLVLYGLLLARRR